MKIMFKILIVGIIFLLSGCYKEMPIVVYSPSLNEVSMVEVGENMFSKTYAYFKTKYYAILVDKNDKIKYETKNKRNFFGEVDGVKCALTLYNYSSSLFDYNCDGYFTHIRKGYFTHSRNGDKLDKPVKYRLIPAKPIKIVEGSFKYGALYQGKVGNKIKIAFKEFVSDNEGHFMIRDAFSQNIEYELDNNGEGEIGFKGLRIKVLKATNLTITYKVKSDYKN